MTFKNSIQSLACRKGSFLPILICWAALCFSASHGQEIELDQSDQQTPLAWEFKQGDQFQVKTTKLSKRTSTLDSRISTIRSDVTIEFSWTVDSVDKSGTATITQELTKLSIDIGDPAVPSQAITYASDDVPADLPTAMRKLQKKTKPLIGLKCVLEMSKNGETKSIQLAADSQKKLEKLSNAPKLKALLSKESLKDIVGGSFLNAIPADSYESGDWATTTEFESGSGSFGEIYIDNDFSAGSEETIKGRKQIKVKIDSTLRPKKADAEMPKAKNEISQSLTSYAGSGWITFDVDGGYFSGSQFKAQIKSERQYREKKILTSLEKESRIEIEKK